MNIFQYWYDNDLPFEEPMTCYHPIHMCYTNKMGPTRTGGFPLVSPKSPTAGKSLKVPCGRCIGCRLEKSRQWAGRIMAEASLHEDNSFLTLTYRDEELVYGGQSHGILIPRHLELFWKRLRKFVGKRVSYYACGEYGDKSSRPHYHACLFGFAFQDQKLWSVKNGNSLYTSDALDGLWTHGRCVIGNLTFESAAYVARYCIKKRLGKTKGTYDEDGITPEFARMSRRPAIGKRWFERFSRDVFPHDSFVVRDFPSKPPRYFFDLYRRLDPALAQYVRDERTKEAISRFEDSTPRRLSEREKVKLSAINPLARPLD